MEYILWWAGEELSRKYLSAFGGIELRDPALYFQTFSLETIAGNLIIR